MGEQNWKGKSKKTHGLRQGHDHQDKDSLSKVKEKNPNFFPRWYRSNHPPQADWYPVSPWATATWDKLLPVPLQSILYGLEHLLSQFESAVPAVASCRPLPTPSLLAMGAEQETGKVAWALCKHCSATAEASTCSLCCFGHQHQAQHHTDCYQEN